MEKRQGLPFKIFGKISEIAYISIFTLQFGKFNSFSFSSSVKSLGWFIRLLIQKFQKLTAINKYSV